MPLLSIDIVFLYVDLISHEIYQYLIEKKCNNFQLFEGIIYLFKNENDIKHSFFKCFLF